MALIVAKFGGTSVADIERIERAAGKIVQEASAGNKVVVVVSAMSGVTNQLVQYCSDISAIHDAVSYTHLRAHEDQRGSRMPSSA